MRKCRAPCRSQTPARNSIDSSDQRQSNPRGRERQYPSDHFQAKKRLYFTFSSWPDPLCGSGISQKSSLSIFFPQQISSTLSSKLRQWWSCHFDKRILILSIEPRPRLVYKPAHEQRTDFICPQHIFSRQPDRTDQKSCRCQRKGCELPVYPWVHRSALTAPWTTN